METPSHVQPISSTNAVALPLLPAGAALPHVIFWVGKSRSASDSKGGQGEAESVEFGGEERS